MSRSLIKFRVYPESRRGFYFEVRIYSTLKEMRDGLNKLCGNNSTFFKDALAGVKGFQQKGWRNKGRLTWSKTLGVIAFNQQHIGTEVVSHESTHAAIAWMRAKELRLYADDYVTDDNEERFCNAVGVIAKQIVAQCYKHNLYA